MSDASDALSDAFNKALNAFKEIKDYRKFPFIHSKHFC
jgi:hypothetical protein